ncbi:hypothetical protein IP91_03231 [Pseudoduganella lurida]|uniref:DUF2486 family protein n=1 Tax=Pseudoduganella lurida TaxID=1036180 RepID=A0A562R7R9_9BURK|nr:hypothetical protein IP91_03231 [Pseudoduganella lurida]
MAPAAVTPAVWRTGAAVIVTALPPAVSAPAAAPIIDKPEQDWAALEQRLNEAVVQQLTARVEAAIEAQVAQALGQLAQDLAGQLRAGLRETIAASVAESVAGQLAQARKE